MTQTPAPPRPPEPRRRSSATRVLIGLTLAAMVLFTGSIGVVAWLVSRADLGDVKQGTFLEVTLEGQLTDAPGQPGLFQEPDALPPTVSEIATSIRRAADDDRITGLYLELDGADAGWASYQEIRAAVETFRASGKPCVSYSPSLLSNGTYYLATACPTVALAPSGASFVTGLAMELTYYKGLFDKIGVNPEFEHVGDFKSFIESYERTEPSGPAAEAFRGLLDAMYAQMVEGIAAGRGQSAEVVRGWVDHPTLTPRVALERGMIDLVVYPDVLRARVHRVGEPDWEASLERPVDDDDEPRLTPLKEYVKNVRAEERASGPKIAVVHAEGSIASGDDRPSLFGDSGLLTDVEYSRWMRQVREDDSIRAVVVRVNSPGGSALAASLMWREHERLQALGKPVVISMGDYAASGGYLMSANADWIVAEPGTLTGSIGVFAGKFDLSGTYEKLGVGVHTIERGAMADMLSFSSGFTDPERAVFREYLEDFYDQFLEVVAVGRDMSVDEVHRVAQGRVWTGSQAAELGLVDELGTLESALAKAAELAELERYTVTRLPRRMSFMELLLQDMSGDAAVRLELPLDLGADALRELAVLERIARDGGLGAYLPGMPRVR